MDSGLFSPSPLISRVRESFEKDVDDRKIHSMNFDIRNASTSTLQSIWCIFLFHSPCARNIYITFFKSFVRHVNALIHDVFVNNAYLQTTSLVLNIWTGREIMERSFKLCAIVYNKKKKK